MMRRHVWMGVETCGDSWKVVKSVLIFIYTPIISISLVSNPSTLRIELLVDHPYPPSHYCFLRCRICSYFRKLTQSHKIEHRARRDYAVTGRARMR